MLLCDQTNQGIKNLTQSDSIRLAGSDPDHATKDLFDSIAAENFPSWTFYIQVMTFAEAERFCWNPFDLTKVLDQQNRSWCVMEPRVAVT